jgi:hypothetical protein
MKQVNTILAPDQNSPLGITERMRALPSLLAVGASCLLFPWTEVHRPGVIAHRKYLRKIDEATGKVTSQLLLSVDIETID